MLRDLEELYLTISDDDAKPLAKDALTSYSSGVFRAAILMMFACVLNRIIKDALYFSSLSRHHRDLIEAFNKSEGGSGESVIISKCKSANMLSTEQQLYIEGIKEWRNKITHVPSANPSAEVARSYIADGISLFLSKNAVNESFVADELIEAVKSSFMISADIGNKQDNTIFIYNKVKPLSYMTKCYLLSKLTKIYLDKPDQELKSRVEAFYWAYAKVYDSGLESEAYYKNVAKPVLHKSNNQEDVIRVCNYFSVLRNMSIDEHNAMSSCIVKALNGVDDLMMETRGFLNMLQLIYDFNTISAYTQCVRFLNEKHHNDIGVASGFMGITRQFDRVCSRSVIGKMGNGSHKVIQSSINAIIANQKILSNTLSDHAACEIIILLCRASRLRSERARSIVDGGFSDISLIMTKGMSSINRLRAGKSVDLVAKRTNSTRDEINEYLKIIPAVPSNA